jgi:hypothetical protein
VIDSAEVVPYTGPAVTLFGTDDPNEVVVEATRHANALAEVVQTRNLFTTIQGKQHVHVDGWTLLGSMTGVFPVEEGEAVPVEVDGVKGFKATVTARTRSGQVVGRATAYCMRDEDRWRSAKLHALASMAQTRATSKALKGPLGFIVKLAGFEPTPAEEMSDVVDGAAQGFANTGSTAGAEASAGEPSEAQKKKVYALMSKLEKADVGMDKETVKRQYAEWYGTEKLSELTRAQISELIERLVAAEERLGV